MEIPNIQIIQGESVTVRTPAYTYDEHMNEREEWSEQVVDNVVVAPTTTSGTSGDVSDTVRPHGTKAILNLGFPKTFDASLRGCHVIVRGREYAVVGDPQPNTAANCPTPWWLSARVEAVDG